MSLVPLMPYHEKTEAFTLIELLVVIAIIGLLATVTAVSVNAARAKSRDSKRVSDMKQIQKALELSYEPGSGYPVVSAPVTIGTPSTDVLCAKGASTGFVADTTAANCDAGKVFMGLVPGNAVPGGTAYTYRSTDANGAACTTAPCNGYCLQANLETGLPQGGLAAGGIIGNQTALKNGTCP